MLTLVDTCGIDFCHQNVIRSPVKIYSAPSIPSFQLSYRSLKLFSHLNRFKRPRIFKVKIILSNKIHQLRIERCRTKAEPKSKNPIQFADIYRSYECIINDNINFHLKR